VAGFEGLEHPAGGDVHELGIACSILEIVEQEIEGRCGDGPRGKVGSVTVLVGQLSSVEPEALSFAWEVARSATICEGTELEIQVVPARAECGTCGCVFGLDDGRGQCDACGPGPFRIVEGRELTVARIVWEPAEVLG
jgi:hydrogenase nickel incorporation protein HypA/HybF